MVVATFNLNKCFFFALLSGLFKLNKHKTACRKNGNFPTKLLSTIKPQMNVC